MSVWTTRASGRDRNYIVLKHTLRGVNYVVNGVRFRNGYAVVEKDSKTYNNLMKVPVLKRSKEYPLIFLRQLSFITRPLDVKMVYGQEVYSHYIKLLEAEIKKEAQDKKIEQEIKHVEEKKLCAFQTAASGGQDLCKNEAIAVSPSGYCNRHILKDPKLSELGIQIPTFIPKKDKAKLSEKVIDQLEKIAKEKQNGESLST